MRAFASPKESVPEKRFAFGRNWERFLGHLTEARILDAASSLELLAGAGELVGRSFLDVGSGSGLSSLSAVRLGASRVHSFDYDAQSVACTRELKRRYCPDATHWTVEQGSALDETYLGRLGAWDVVYSWGVLHHTGAMWRGVSQIMPLVRPGGLLLIALYNDQGWQSRVWTRVKALYNGGPVGRALVKAVGVPAFLLAGVASDAVRLRNPLARYRTMQRGMSPYHDWIDWLGGFPFEVARPADVIEFVRRHGFVLERLHDVGGRLGCNEFAFRRS